MSFLKAEWRKLAFANYEVDPGILKKYIPYGTELDLRNNQCYVSIVGFMFINTRLMGLKIPFHTNFEEVNLRFYVKRYEDNAWKRGVVFIKEIVPKPALTLIANMVYKENYETLKMKHLWIETNEKRSVEYSWRKNRNWNTIKIDASVDSKEIEPESFTEFITEHYWGYARINSKQSIEYEVTHPKWREYAINGYEIDIDFGINYGLEFNFLSNQNPTTVMLAEGSEITVERKRRI